MDGDKQTRDRRLALIVLLAGLTLLLLSLGMRARAETPPAEEATTETRSQIRAARRAYDGAPPVIPHEDFGLECAGCHDAEGGMELEEGAVAPPNPHLETRGLSDQARCRQCHGFKTTDEVFRENAFVGIGRRLARVRDRRGDGRRYGGRRRLLPWPLDLDREPLGERRRSDRIERAPRLPCRSARNRARRLGGWNGDGRRDRDPASRASVRPERLDLARWRRASDRSRARGLRSGAHLR